jgi:hypothetical protein
MSVAFNILKPEDTLYDCSKIPMGNTTVKVLRVLPIKVFEVNVEQGRALISWNGNQVQWRYASYFKTPNIRRFPPEWIPRVGKEPVCHMCGATQSNGHRPDCKHPKAP